MLLYNILRLMVLGVAYSFLEVGGIFLFFEELFSAGQFLVNCCCLIESSSNPIDNATGTGEAVFDILAQNIIVGLVATGKSLLD